METYNLIRMLIVFVGGLNIYFGYKLFYLVTERQGKLKIEGKDATVSLSDVGPCVFFSFFGSIILVSVIVTQPYKEITLTQNGVEDLSKITQKIRAPASINKDMIDISSMCVQKDYEDVFFEGVDLLDATKLFYQKEPYKKFPEQDRKALIDYLDKSKSEPKIRNLAGKISDYTDCYHYLISYLFFFYLSHRC